MSRKMCVAENVTWLRPFEYRSLVLRCSFAGFTRSLAVHSVSNFSRTSSPVAKIDNDSDKEEITHKRVMCERIKLSPHGVFDTQIPGATSSARIL